MTKKEAKQRCGFRSVLSSASAWREHQSSLGVCPTEPKGPGFWTPVLVNGCTLPKVRRQWWWKVQITSPSPGQQPMSAQGGQFPIKGNNCEPVLANGHCSHCIGLFANLPSQLFCTLRGTLQSKLDLGEPMTYIFLSPVLRPHKGWSWRNSPSW